MNRRCLALAALLVFPALATGTPASSIELFIVHEDPLGDTEAGLFDQPDARVPFADPATDLLAIGLRDSPSEIRFQISVERLPLEGEAEGALYWVDFLIGETPFSIVISKPNFDQLQGFWRAQIAPNPSYEQTNAEPIEVLAYPRLNSIEAIVPRIYLEEVLQRPLLSGTPIGPIGVHSTQIRPLGAEPWIGDFMNHDLADSSTYSLQFGPLTSNGLQLQAIHPFRISNGVAATYAFSVTITGDQTPGMVEMDATNVPASWDVDLPEGRLHWSGDGPLIVPIFVNVPFSHEHGAVERFQATATHENGAQGIADLGVIFTATPQPSGHHETLYIHSYENGRDGYINTLQEDPADSGQAIGGVFPLFDGQFRFPLLPSLAMGLDFDLNRNGTLSFEVEAQALQEGVRISAGAVEISGPNGTVPVAEVIQTSDPTGLLSHGGRASIEAAIVPLPSADRIPYFEGQNLYLNVSLTSGLTAATEGFNGARIVPGGTLVLPLFEYHEDPVDLQAAAVGFTVTLRPDTPLRANPGDLVALTGFVSTPREFAAQFEVKTAPSNLDIELETATTTVRDELEVAFTIRIPSDAQPGDTVDILFKAQDAKQPEKVAFARTTVSIIDPGVEDLPSAKSLTGDAPKKSSIGAPGLVAMALAAVMLGRRS